MDIKRVIVLFLIIFLLFLGFYTWNARTGKLDAFGSNVGLELGTVALRFIVTVNNIVNSTWENYVDLVEVRQENIQLKKETELLQLELAKLKENENELNRLRGFYELDALFDWPKVGAKVLAWRYGVNNYMESVTLSKGYYNGAKPKTPLIVPSGLLGRVIKSGPYTSIALLITDPASSVAVISSNGRVPGILQGQGGSELLEMQFVKFNEEVLVGEILITSGTDLSYPKGIPVAEVVSVEHGADAMLKILARPLVVFNKVEEVLLLQNPFEDILPVGSPVYSPHPNDLIFDDQLLVPENN